MSVHSTALLAAELTLQAVEREMAADFASAGTTWPREWMQKHADNRVALNKTRMILLDLIDKQTLAPSTANTAVRVGEPVHSRAGSQNKSGEE